MMPEERTRELAERRLDAGLALAAERYGTPHDGGADVVSEDGSTVIVAGREVVTEGKLRTADIDQIRAEAATAASRLWAAMRSL